MKNTRVSNTQKFSLQQKLEKVSTSWNIQGLRRQASSPSSLISEYGQFSNQAINGVTRSRVAKSIFSRALIAACAIVFLLLSCIGAIEGIMNAQAEASHLSSAPIFAVKPTRTPPGRHTPTPTPSPTLAATLTTIPTVSANTTPPVQGATPQATQKQGGSPKPTPISTLPTPSTTSTVLHTSSQQEGNPPLSLVIIETLSGIGGVMLLLAIGLLLLRKYHLPSAKVKLLPSGAPPWQRVRINSLDDHMSNSGHYWQRRQTLDGISPSSNDYVPMTDGYFPITRNVIPSRRGLSSTTSGSIRKKMQLKLHTKQLLRPTRLKKMHNSGIVVEHKQSAFNLSRQNSQQGAVPREPEEERDSEEAPSLDDPFLQETLQYYILRGQLARQSNAREQQEQEL